MTDKKRVFFIPTVIIIGVFTLLLLTSYAWYTFAGGSTAFSTQTYNEYIDVQYNSSSFISVNNAVPISDSDIDSSAESNNFSVSIVSNTFPVSEAVLSISLVNINIDKELLNTDFRYQLLQNNNVIKEGTSLDFLGNTSIDSVGSSFIGNRFELVSKTKISSYFPNNFKFRVWISDQGTTQNDMQNKSFSGSIEINAVKIRKDNGDYNAYNEALLRHNNIEGVTISTTDHDDELRFIGANPNNYVKFNNEATCDENGENCSDVKWRIIGVFNGQLKIIRESIGEYSWDTSGSSVNNGYGINQWGESGTYEGADLMRLLNPGYSGVNGSLYYNAESGTCYESNNNITISCDFSSTGLKDSSSKNMIDDYEWNAGTINASSDGTGTWTASLLYDRERSDNNGKQCTSGNYCNDSVTRTTTWTGKVGLMYPSDYLYATSGGNTTNRSTCLGYSGYSWYSSSYSDCKTNSWLYDSSHSQWVFSPRANSSNSNDVFNVYSDGSVSYHFAYNAYVVRPVVYLKSSVTISGGDGTQSNPYTLVTK